MRESEKREPAKRNMHELSRDVRKLMNEEAMLGYPTEGPELKARCKRLSNKTITVGNTVFKFDKEGITKVLDYGYAQHDYEFLIRMNGVEAINFNKDSVYTVSNPMTAIVEEKKEDRNEPESTKIQDKSPRIIEKGSKKGNK